MFYQEQRSQLIQLRVVHDCTLPGFVLTSSHPLCRQCECDRLMALGVPRDIAWSASVLRQLMLVDDPDSVTPKIMAELRESLAELEKEYGKEIPELPEPRVWNDSTGSP